MPRMTHNDVKRVLSARIWWQLKDGMAIGHPDTPEVRDRVDALEPGWYGSIEGCIIHGGVKAVAYRRWTEKTYDAAAWLFRDERIETGEVTHTMISAGDAYVDPSEYNAATNCLRQGEMSERLVEMTGRKTSKTED